MSQARSLSTYWMTADQFMTWPSDGTGRTFQLVDSEPLPMPLSNQTHGHIRATVIYPITWELRALKSASSPTNPAATIPPSR